MLLRSDPTRDAVRPVPKDRTPTGKLFDVINFERHGR